MNEKTEPTTAELKRHLETIIVGDSRYVQEVCGDALEVIEQQERRISELERIIDERKQKYAVLDTEAAEMRVRIYELERQIETDRAEWEPIWANRCDMQRKRVLDLERELAAAKADITSIAKQSVEDFEKRAWTPPCRFCVKFEECDFIPTDGGCCFEWRGAREGEGK